MVETEELDCVVELAMTGDARMTEEVAVDEIVDVAVDVAVVVETDVPEFWVVTVLLPTACSVSSERDEQ